MISSVLALDRRDEFGYLLGWDPKPVHQADMTRVSMGT